MELQTRCSPTANGRKPIIGESRWTMELPLEDGTILRLIMGAEGHHHMRKCFLQEAADDTFEKLMDIPEEERRSGRYQDQPERAEWSTPYQEEKKQ